MSTMKIRKSDDFYQEALVWMGYRYAIGLTGRSSEKGKELVNSLKQFSGIEYDTPEFHALAAEIANYLKRKKIKDVVDLSNRWMERDMMWYAYHYAEGSHSYAGALCRDIDPRMHKRCRVCFNGEEQVVEYFDSWRRRYGVIDGLPYEKLKRPVNSYEKNPQICTYINEAFIVEDGV